ncbi:hypothetical protein CHS0354_036952 [Potamilus streckersoni]|uniref:Uncharacterized protein n=1 Tax=Potamilus streckersoni TaxID=2493646 RepID=A0AAE0TBL4_9BIVA|nr:hypothetical protein CHS0354_036952 [Potamilus streckersoni]
MFTRSSENCTTSKRMECLDVEDKFQVPSIEDRQNIIIQERDQLLMKNPKVASCLDSPRPNCSCSCRKGLRPGKPKSLSIPVITIDHVITTEDQNLGSSSTEHFCYSKKSSPSIRKGSNESLTERNYLRVEECFLTRGGVVNRPSSAKSESYCMVNNRPLDTRRYSMPAIKIEHQHVDNIINDGSLSGHDMSSFYCLWNRPKSPKLLGRGALDVPNALKRQGIYRDCGCMTREAHQHFDHCKRSKQRKRCINYICGNKSFVNISILQL